MQQTKVIKIYLASSTSELQEERVILGDYIMNTIRSIFRNDGIDVKLLRWEYMISDNAGKLIQEVIDDRIRECDISIFLFKYEISRWTLSEFYMARGLSKTVLVYFFDVAGEKSNQLKTFQRLVSGELLFRYCKDIDSLKSQVMHSLLLYAARQLNTPAEIEQKKYSNRDKDSRILDYATFITKESMISWRKKTHKSIYSLLRRTKSVMENEKDSIDVKIDKIIELYKKADRLAAASDYDKEKYSNLLFDYAKFLYDYGLYKDSEVIYLRQIGIAEELYGKEHEKTSISYNSLGSVYNELGNSVKALEYNLKALAIQEKAYGTDHPNTAISCNNIGELYLYQGDYDKALEYYSKALTIREKTLGPDHPDTATSYNNIGEVYHYQGDYDKALEYYLKALEIREKAFGVEHSDVAVIYNNIGGIFGEQGNYDKALEYYFKALVILVKVLGSYHPIVGSSYNNVGWVYYQTGEYQKALEYYDKALAIREKVFGLKHLRTATIYNNIGLVYDVLDDHPKALEYYNKAYQIRKEKLGPEDAETKNTLEKIDNVNIVDNLKVTLLKLNRHNSLKILSESTSELRSCFNCTECSLWNINHNSTHNNDQNNDNITVSLIHREVQDVKYLFDRDVDYVHKTKRFFLNYLTEEGKSGSHFFRLNNKSPELSNFISQEFVGKDGLTDFIIIPIPDEQDKTRIIAFLEVSHTNSLFSDDIWKELSSFIQNFFSAAFERVRIFKEHDLIEILIKKHGESKDKESAVLFNEIFKYVLFESCPAQNASLFIWDSYQNRYSHIVTSSLEGNPILADAFYHKGEEQIGRIGQTRKPLIIDDLAQDGRGKCNEKLQDDAIREMYIPIINPTDENDVIGVFKLVNKTNVYNKEFIDYFNDSDVDMMKDAADYMALVIANYQKEELQYNFIDKLTHEIITPANAIWKTANRLYAHLEDNEFIDRHLSSYLKNIIDFAELQRWQASTNLFLSRNRRKQSFEVRYCIRPTLLYEVIKKSIELAVPVASKYNVQSDNIVLADLFDKELLLNIDKDAFITVFYNLFTNAIKYHDPNAKEQFYIKVSYKMKSDQLVINIEDNGIGISNNEKDLVFETGYRSVSAIRNNASGYGIGLTVVKQIIEDFDGEISIANNKKPTIFRIRIPKNKIQ